MRVGIDIIEVSRIKGAVEAHSETFLKKLFTPKEIEYFLKYTIPYTHIAGHFAAKEAVSKALGVGIGHSLQWKDIIISHNEKGAPLVNFPPKVIEQFSITTTNISISHCKEYATAIAIIS